MKKILLLLFFLPSILFGVNAGDIKIAQRNSTNTAWIDVIFATSPSSLIGTNSSGVPIITTGGGGGSGTVTSVAASGGSTGFSFTGTPITTTGTLTLTLSDAAAARSALGLVIGTNVQAYDADLAALAALSGTNTIYYRSGVNTWSPVTIGGNLTFSSGTLNAVSGSSPSWGSISGTLSDQTDLNTALGLKANKSQIITIATFIFGDGVSVPSAAIVTNAKPNGAACTITGYRITGDQISGSAVVDIKVATSGISFSSIVASAPPTLTGQNWVNSTSVGTWTVNLSNLTDLQAVLTSVSTHTRVVVALFGTLN